MQEIVFATNNKHKLEEIRLLLKDKFKVLSLKDIGFEGEIPEPYPTIEQNSQQKAKYIYEFCGCNVFADDTGLEVEALNGRPGVHSARYAGENSSYKENMWKVLNEMKGKTNRKARFITVITLIWEGNLHIFKGIVNGKITEKPIGNNGFGYDPIFIPDGYNITYAQMDTEMKNLISHRGIAIRQLLNFLNTLNTPNA